MAYIMVFDTETTDLAKCFCYDVGYCIIDTENQAIIERKHFVVEQVWHNLPLFESAYYKEKRPDYVQLMRAHKAFMLKWGHITQEMRRDIKGYNITDAYAYNSDFDDKVFTYNCDWFKTINPFDNVAIHDIWGYTSQYITNRSDYKIFCEQNQRFTDTGNYSGNAETVYQFITNNPSFIEKHMGLYDSEIEAAILLECFSRGAELNKDYKVIKILPRVQEKPFTIKVDNTIIYEGTYTKKYSRNDVYTFKTIKGG